ncbi:MAG: pyridoxal phosphate-dependent aminotransferase [Crocinitomicaceae bacterium]|nr:pyridoxal phosphate-dependent aminotransferase [Crocinitomicaceae bacterium]MCF8409780.1 pyridoxal phosphate-dependent aminotransferase [Crocinitomicaceae bacterium]MCF8443484.1 pyridoxal phosphate-dependent aminotransferase [Crocinitomicaceae bacterium]
MGIFQPSDIEFQLLKERAYNLRWATVPEGVIPLTAADPDFKTAPVIRDAIADYCRGGYFSYTPAEGLPEFKDSLQTFFRDRRNCIIPSNQILPVDSAAFGIFLICKSILNRGDEAIIFDPVDFLFQYSIEKVGAKPVRFAIPSGIKNVDFTLIEKLITPKTKMICLCNPLNPTGKVFTREELEVLGNIAVKYNLLILSDEIWSDIVYKPNTFTSIASISDDIALHTVIVTGFSKSYGLAGLRIGVVAAVNQEIFQTIFENSLHQSTIHGVNSIGQIAATAALNNAQTWLDEFVSHLQNMRDLVTQKINSINGLETIAPEGCYVSLIDIRSTGLNSEEFARKMLEKAKVAVVPGLTKWFGPGAEGYVRISFATSSDILMEALNRIEENL